MKISTAKIARYHYRIRDILSEVEDKLETIHEIPHDGEIGRVLSQIENKVDLAKQLIRRNWGDENDVDPENIYNLPGIRQSIEEDRRR